MSQESEVNEIKKTLTEIAEKNNAAQFDMSVVNDSKNVELTAEELEKQKKKKEERTKKLKEMHDDYDKQTEEYNKQKFLVVVTEDVAKAIYDYIINEAEWKYSEAVGIIELEKVLKAEREVMRKNRQKGLMLTTNSLEALNYYYSRKVGKGIRAAQTFLDQLKPIGMALSESKARKKELDELGNKIAAFAEGIELAPEKEKPNRLAWSENKESDGEDN